jgi:hypothetical protein
VTADVGVCDTLVLAQLLVENARLRGDLNRTGFSGGRVVPAATAVGGRSDGSTRFRIRWG